VEGREEGGEEKEEEKGKDGAGDKTMVRLARIRSTVYAGPGVRGFAVRPAVHGKQQKWGAAGFHRSHCHLSTSSSGGWS
jgi:hypothetical protein